jgi:hypothetical protein
MVTEMMNLAAGNHVGDGVTVLWVEGLETRVGYGHVASEVPFAIELDGKRWPSAQTEVRLVRDQGERWVAGKAHVAVLDEGLTLLHSTQWEEPSQRVFERRAVDWPATLRILDDRGTRETFQIGLTIDVSLGGAGVRMEEAPEVGSLVEYRAMPRGEIPLRAVGVVVRRQGDQIGLAFLYMWGAHPIETQQYQELRRAA